jgi:hypothetical protein
MQILGEDHVISARLLASDNYARASVNTLPANNTCLLLSFGSVLL